MEFYNAIIVGALLDVIHVRRGEAKVERFATEAAAEKAASLWAVRLVESGASVSEAGHDLQRPTGAIATISKAVALLGEGTFPQGLTFLFKVEVTWTGVAGVIGTAETTHLVKVRIQRNEEPVLSESDLDTETVSCRAIKTHLDRIENEKMIARMAAEREAINQKFAKSGRR